MICGTRASFGKIAGASFYEERLLFLLIRLRYPRARMVYVTSQPIHPIILEYYLQFLAGIPASHARSRLTLLCADDASPRSLTEKILERPRLIERIRAGIVDPQKAYLTVFNSTPHERKLAVLLGIPLNGCDPQLASLGTKSGSRKVFRKAGVALPEGFEDLHTLGEIEEALAELHSTPFKILKWHGFIDLDDDEYIEPYVVTVDEKTGKVLLIVARYYDTGITRQDDRVIRIEPIEYFTKYDFIPNPSGGIYGIGFGILLGPLNESTNTLINQLVDAGTLSNMQSGFISRNLRMRNGRANFSPGEWKEVNASGMDLRQGILPLPVREPSMVLFQLLQLLIGSGESLTSTTDMMVGVNPGQNQKATTTMAVLDQGMKVFTAIYKRVRRAMTKEFQKVFDLNYYYLDEDRTKILFDGVAKMQRMFYNKEQMVVFPSADPNISSSTEKVQQAQALLGMLELGGFNEYEIKRRALDALGVPDPDSLLIPPEAKQPPPPDPKLLKEMREAKNDEFEQRFNTLELMHTIQKDNKELDIKEEEMATNRLKAMLDGFAKGANVSHQNRALIQKELADKRKANAAKSKSE